MTALDTTRRSAGARGDGRPIVSAGTDRPPFARHADARTPDAASPSGRRSRRAPAATTSNPVSAPRCFWRVAQRRGERVVRDDALERRGQRVRVAGRDEQATVAQRLAQPGEIARHDRRTPATVAVPSTLLWVTFVYGTTTTRAAANSAGTSADGTKPTKRT